MKYKLLPTILLTFYIISCGSTYSPKGPKLVTITEPFNQAEQEAGMVAGDSTINGNAFLRQRGGAVVTCAGSDVMLWTATTYSKARIKALYQSEEGGYMPRYRLNVIRISETPPAYVELRNKTVCDSEGRFTFKNISNGDYYLFTEVTWTARNIEGGLLIKKVTVGDNETVDVIITQ